MTPQSPTSDYRALTYRQPHPNLPVSDPDLGITIAIEAIGVQVVDKEEFSGKGSSRRISGTAPSTKHSKVQVQRTLVNGDAGVHASNKKKMNTGGTDFGKLGR